MSKEKVIDAELTSEVVILGEEFLTVKEKRKGAAEASERNLKRFKNMMETKETFRVKITKADDKLNFYMMLPGGIEGVIPNVELYGKLLEPRERGHFVGKEFVVAVIEVNEETKVVTLSHERARAMGREKLIEQIKNAHASKQKVMVRAKIMDVNYTKRVLLDLGGVGLLGIIPQKEWKHGHEYHIEQVAKKGTVIEVVPLEYKPATDKKKECFICSRRALLPDPWDTIKEKFPVNTTLIVTCIEKKDHHFFSRTDGFEPDVFCEYPNEDKNIRIIVGRSYKGYVYRSEKKSKALMVRILQEVKPDK